MHVLDVAADWKASALAGRCTTVQSTLPIPMVGCRSSNVQREQGVPLHMSNIRPEHPAVDLSDSSVAAAEILVREEPDEEEDEEDDREQKEDDDENEDDDEGYSE